MNYVWHNCSTYGHNIKHNRQALLKSIIGKKLSIVGQGLSVDEALGCETFCNILQTNSLTTGSEIIIKSYLGSESTLHLLSPRQMVSA